MRTSRYLFAAICFTALIALGMPGRSEAQTSVYDNGGPSVDAGGVASDFAFPFQTADDFVLSASQTINRVGWWGQYLPGNNPSTADAFTIRIFADAGGVPAVNPVYQAVVGDVGRTNTGLVSFDFDIYSYGSSIPDVSLGAGTYWLSIVNDTTADTSNNWYWSRVSLDSGNSQGRNADGQMWSSALIGTDEMAFNLSVIPEPGSATLLAISGVTLLLRRRRDASENHS